MRAEQADGDGPLWAATAALLGTGRLDDPRAALRLRGDAASSTPRARAAAGDEAVERALAAHVGRLRVDSRPMVAALLAPLHLLAVESAAEEGKKTILMMLAVGGVFIGVIALGELTHWLRNSR